MREQPNTRWWLVPVLALVSTGVTAQTISLPSPRTSGDVPVESAIQQRQSVRRFSDEALTLAEAGQLLWAASGSTVDGVSGPTRAAASAGGLYPVASYLVAEQVDGLEPGVYRYRWGSHELETVRSGSRLGQLHRAALLQGAVRRAPAVIVIAADYEVTERRYGERGTERYVHMDAGHAAQNVHLQATALELGSVPIGAFSDRQVRRTLGIDLTPLYIIPVGTPAAQHR